MLGKELLAYVDHTLLRPTATWDDIKEVCEDGIRYKTASVCIPPDFVASAHEAYPELNICTVIGFPLGYETTEVKVAETKQAIEEGASEIDMVINLGDVKQGDFEAVTSEIEALKKACGDKILKVIIETCYLTDSEKVALCKCITNGAQTILKHLLDLVAAVQVLKILNSLKSILVLMYRLRPQVVFALLRI